MSEYLKQMNILRVGINQKGSTLFATVTGSLYAGCWPFVLSSAAKLVPIWQCQSDERLDWPERIDFKENLFKVLSHEDDGIRTWDHWIASPSPLPFSYDALEKEYLVNDTISAIDLI